MATILTRSSRAFTAAQAAAQAGEHVDEQTFCALSATPLSGPTLSTTQYCLKANAAERGYKYLAPIQPIVSLFLA